MTKGDEYTKVFKDILNIGSLKDIGSLQDGIWSPSASGI